MLPILPTITPGEPLMVRPSWCDPAFIRATNELVQDKLTIVAGVPTLLLPANPKRWAFGISLGPGPPAPLLYGLNSSLATTGWSISGSNALVWHEMFKYGPLVMQEIWVISSSGQSVNYLTLEIQ